jgi:hypothetical protein
MPSRGGGGHGLLALRFNLINGFGGLKRITINCFSFTFAVFPSVLLPRSISFVCVCSDVCMWRLSEEEQVGAQVATYRSRGAVCAAERLKHLVVPEGEGPS